MDIFKTTGLTDEVLLSCNVPTLNLRFCTNELILALSEKSKVLFPKKSISKLITWTALCFDTSTESINVNAFKGKLQRLKQELAKKRGEKKTELLKQRFQVPCHTSTSTQSFERDVSQIISSELIETKKSLEDFKSQAEQEKAKNKEVKYENLLLKRKLKRARDSIEREKGKLLEDSKSCMTPDVKRQKLHDKKTIQMERKIKSEKLIKRRIQTDLTKTRTALRNKTIESQNLQTKLHNVTALIEDCTKEIQEAVRNKRNDLKSINNLKKDNEYLQSLVNDDEVLTTTTIGVGEKEIFHPRLTECVWNLTSLNVAASKVGDVIKEVCNMCDKKPTKLPSERTVNRMNIRKESVSLKQMEEVTAKSNLTLYSDETSKFGKSFEVFAVTDSEQNSYLLGLREMANKSASTVLDTLKTIIEDINEASENPDTKTGEEILSLIKNTMSDRASTEKKFHSLLESYRQEILPTVISKWEEMSEVEQKSCSTLNNFFCGLHLLVGCADVCASAINKFEKMKADSSPEADKSEEEQEDPIVSGKESGTLRLIRCSSKAFARGADEKSGVHGYWRSYTDEKGQKVGFLPFKHNRFNVVFLLGGVTYHHRNRIQDFLENVHGVTNRLLEQIAADVKSEIYIAGCRAFGLISKQITSPLWRLIEGNLHILEMNTQYTELCSFLENLKGAKAVEFIHGESTPFGDAIGKDDEIHKVLTAVDNSDDLTAEVIEVLAESILSLLHRQLEDQLPGGKYAEFTEELKNEASSAMKHNKLPEFFFGQLDFLLKYRPNASLICNEAFLMFSHNKTGQWLKSLPKEKKEKLIMDSSKHGNQIKKLFKARLAEIKVARLEALKQKQNQIETARRKKLQERESLTNDICFYGLWQTEEEIGIKLAEIRTKGEKKKAVQKQLNFRKKVLRQQTADPGIFAFSKKIAGKNKQHPLEVLVQNLKQLIVEACSIPGRQEERSRTHGPLLVGKNIKHTFGDGITYNGTVISVVPGYPSWYNVKYADDDNLYVYDLMVDYSSGDLRIVVDQQ